MNNENSLIVIDTPEGIAAYRLLTMRSALHLETLGMKASRGVNVCKMVKDQYGFKGRDKKEILRQFENYLEGDLGMTLNKRYTERTPAQ